MQIERLEKVFLAIGVAFLTFALIAIAASVFMSNIHLPRPEARVNPRELASTEPFNNPGFHELEPGKWEAAITAFRFGFGGFPSVEVDGQRVSQIEVPAGTEITFHATSLDVIHGIMIEGTDINTMVIPGEVSKFRFTFNEPGTYLVICHEYCGTQHHVMYARIVVTEAGAVAA